MKRVRKRQNFSLASLTTTSVPQMTNCGPPGWSLVGPPVSGSVGSPYEMDNGTKVKTLITSTHSKLYIFNILHIFLDIKLI